VNISLVQIFGALLTIGVRLTGIMLFAPFFGSVAIPARVKAVLVLALTALLYPMTAAKIPQMSISHWPMMVFSELLIGVALGVTTNVVFDGVQMAGQVLSVQMGYSLVNILDPQTQVESTVVATFHQTIAMLIFLRLNVHFWILRAASTICPLPLATLEQPSRRPRWRQERAYFRSASRLPHRYSRRHCLPTWRSACSARRPHNCR